jgi:sugar phosphate isomerase/epimerase
MATIPIGLQLYSVREDCTRDLPATLAAVTNMGYVGVEFAGYYDYSAGDLRKTLDGLGLKCCGTHTRLETLLGDELPRTIDFNLELGNRFLIVPALPEERRSSRSAWRETAELFTELAEKARPHGMRIGYHNHHIEFSPLEGELPWDTFFRAAAPEVVMQLDTGNCLHGGGDPVEFLKRYPGRALTVHLKEYSAENDRAVIGEGDVQWGEVFSLCETVGGTEWYIVEQETYAYPPLVCVEKCLQNLREMGK